MEQKGLSKSAENAIAFGIAAAFVIAIIVMFGWNSVKTWISEPLKWKIPDGVDITYNGAIPDSYHDEDLDLYFSIYNSTGKEIDEYYFVVAVGDAEIKTHLNPPAINAYGSTELVISVTTDTSSMRSINETDFYKLKNGTYTNNDMKYKIQYMESHGETLVSNNGWVKNLIIIVVSFVCGLIGFQAKISSPVLRIVFKTLGMPGILLVLGVMAFSSISDKGSAPTYSGTGYADNSARQQANKRYKRAAQLKAGAEMHGNARDAARAQKEMDDAMADMIAGSGSRDAKQRYKRYAGWEAGAKMTGNSREAARARADKEQALADIITDAARNK